MEVRKRAIRIGALGAMLFTTSAMVFNGVAGAEATEKPHKGDVHIDKNLHMGKGVKDVKLDRQCAVLVRPHDYRGYDNVSFTLTAQGKKPTASAPFAVGMGDATTTTLNPSWDGLDPVIVHLDAIKDLAAPHGKIKTDKNGKVHNNLHWHVRITVQDSLGKKFKKDVRVFNCDPKLPPADECDSQGPVFGDVIGVDNNKFAQLGGGLGVNYVGADPLEDEDVTFTIDGDEVDTLYLIPNGAATKVITMVPALDSGSHTAVITVDPDGDGETTSCGTTTIVFKTNQGNSNT